MFDPETVAFLESGCALIIGTRSDDGTPWAGRGWGMNVVGDERDHVRLLLDIDDATTVAHARDHGPIAVTGACVPTLRSVQVKGRVVEVHEATDRDRDRADQFCDDFFDDILRTDGTPRVLPERLRPRDYVVTVIAVDEVFDQTPGPGAGVRLAAEGT